MSNGLGDKELFQIGIFTNSIVVLICDAVVAEDL